MLRSLTFSRRVVVRSTCTHTAALSNSLLQHQLQSRCNTATTASPPATSSRSDEKSKRAGPLSHIRVLDLSRVLAGPWATQLLGDLGAEVIKIEKPGEGDDTRRWGPPFYEKGEDKFSAYYLSANRNKKSVTVNIRDKEGQEIVRRLAAKCDVFIENFAVGTMKKYGLSYEDIKKVNKNIIYCSITGFGQDGPYADKPGYDFMIQGTGGIMSITGPKEESTDASGPANQPQKIGVALTDILTGMYSTVGILAGIINRDHKVASMADNSKEEGFGQYIDVGLLDVQVAVLANQAMNYLVTGVPPVRLGNSHPNIAPYDLVRTKDGHMIIAVGNNEQFTNLCNLLGLPELASDPKFATNASRVKHRNELMHLLEGKLIQHDKRHWLQELERVRVPCGPINNIQEAFEHEQVRHRNMVWTLQTPHGNPMPLVGNPLHYGAGKQQQQHQWQMDDPAQHSTPPALGQHTESVLRELLSVDAQQIAAWKEKNII